MENRLLTPDEAGEQLGLSTGALAQLRYMGGGPCFIKLTAVRRTLIENFELRVVTGLIATDGKHIYADCLFMVAHPSIIIKYPNPKGWFR